MTTNHSRPHAVLAGLLHAAVAALLVFTAPATVTGQEADEIIEELAGPQGVRLAEGGFIYQGKGDIDGGGSFEALRFDVGLLGTFTLSERWRWRNASFLGAHAYDFDSAGFGAGDPWDTTLSMRFGSALTYALDDTWGISAGGIFMLTPETNAKWGDSFSGGGTLGVEYRHSETLFASLGAAVISQIEDDAMVTPMIGVNWRPGPQWTLRVGAVPASGGAAAAGELAYRISAPLELGFGGAYHNRRFRLDDSGPAPKGIGVDDNLPVRLRVGWNLTQSVALNFLAGVVLGGEVALEDRHGNRLRKEDYDPAAYLGLRLLAQL